MLDLKRLRTDLDALRAGLGRKQFPAARLDELAALDAKRRDLQAEADRLKAEKNAKSKEIGAVKKAGGDIAAVMEAVKDLGAKIEAAEAASRAVEADLDAAWLEVPNIPHDSVPDGPDAASNREERRWGTPRRFDFPVKSHDELGVALGILDFERAAKVSGARFVFQKGLGARLERALMTFMLDLHTKEHGYTELWAPFLVRAEALVGTGNLPKFEADLFKVPPDHYLIPTAEVPVTNYHREEILDESALPIAYCAYTPCFRSEAGSHGKDVKGMIRQHQFDKVELVRFCTPEQGLAQHDLLTGHAEKVLQVLELPYRVVTLCTGDMSFSSHRTHDLEVWLPSQNTYREISSCSTFSDFQARRASIRYRDKAGKVGYVHTLNGSGLAIGRTLVALLENGQQADGSVILPGALAPYLGTDRIV